MNRLAITVLFSLGFLLSACDSTHKIAENLNPVDWFSLEKTNAEAEIPGSDEDFPKLTQMSQSPFDGGISRNVQNLEKGLAADRQNALYTDQELRKMVSPSRIGIDEATESGDEGQSTESLNLKDDGGMQAEIAENMANPLVTAPPSASLTGNEKPEQLAGLDGGVLTNHPLSQARKIGDFQRVSGSNGRLLANLVYTDNRIETIAGDEKILGEIARFFKDYEVKRLYIVGHASPSDTTGYTSGLLTSYKVALDRATYVGTRLIELGLPSNVIQVDSKGVNQPIYSEATPNGVIGNRRVEVYVEF